MTADGGARRVEGDDGGGQPPSAAAVREVLAGLAALGRPTDRIAPEDLAPIDDFHMGGRAATLAVLKPLGLAAGDLVLDIGCAFGGTSRHIARHYGCRVVGLDRAAGFVAAAALLNARTGLADRIDLVRGDALALPFAADSFDAAVLLHVGMNLPDKAAMAGGIARVLKPGARLALYDVMLDDGGAGEIAYPVAWAETAAESFPATRAAYHAALAGAGLTVLAERSHHAAAFAGLRRLQALYAAGPRPLGPQLLMGRTTAAKLANMVAALERGLLDPVEIQARRAGPHR